MVGGGWRLERQWTSSPVLLCCTSAPLIVGCVSSAGMYFRKLFWCVMLSKYAPEATQAGRGGGRGQPTPAKQNPAVATLRPF